MIIPLFTTAYSSRVDASCAVTDDLPNDTLLLEILQRLSRQAAIDLQSVYKHSHCDETVGLDIFVELVGGGFVEHDGMVGLVLDYIAREMLATWEADKCRENGNVGEGELTLSLGPLLLLLLAASCSGRLCSIVSISSSTPS